MTMSLVVEHFDDLLATPEDVEQLNRAILQLAMQGKLVEQNPNDEPAGELLKHIRAGNTKESKPTLEITEDEQPFELPCGWKWVRLGELCRLENGDRSKANYPNKSILVKEGVPFVNAGHLVDGRIDRSTITFIPKEKFDRLRSGKFTNGDILFCLRGSLGKSAIVEGFDAGAIASSLVILKIHPYLSNYYLLNYFDSPLASEMIKKYDNGTAQPNLSAASLAKFLIPLPPLAEQRRIVARVEELFAKTRALAKELAHSQIELDGLNKSALSHLLASETSEEFNQHWDFIAEHFDLLFQAADHVAPLRQSILELAVRGKLTRREVWDEPVAFPKSQESKKLFDLPEAWTWFKMHEIGKISGGITKNGQRDSLPLKMPYLRVGNVYSNELRLDDVREIGVEPNEIKRTMLEDGDLLVVEGNGSIEQIGRVAVWRGQVPSCLHQNHIIKVRFEEKRLVEFILFWLLSPSGRRQITDSAISTTGLHTLSLSKVSALDIPLPPLAEQERIVKRVEQLLSLCDALEARLQSAEEERGRLVAAVMSTVGG